MFLININNILHVWTTHYDILSTLCRKKFTHTAQTKILLSICGKDKLYISGMYKSIFVYIEYGHFFIYII